jgi:hypothetical protein
MRQPHAPLEHAVDHRLEAGDGVIGEEPHQSGAVEGRPRRKPQADRDSVGGGSHVVPSRLPQRAGRALVDRRHGVVELPDAGEPRRERHIGDGQVGRHQQRARVLGAVGPGERERAGAQLGHEHAGQVARRVAEAGGEAGDALALHDAVGDEPHRAAREIVVRIPVGGAGHGVGQAAFAGAEAGLVGRGGGAVERHVLRVRGHGGAARPAVDSRRVHARDELAVEARVARRHGAVPLGEVRVCCGGVHALRVTPATDNH